MPEEGAGRKRRVSVRGSHLHSSRCSVDTPRHLLPEPPRGRESSKPLTTGGGDDKGNADEAAGSPAAKGSGGGAKKRSSLPTLRRPIICICNDLYAPSLRPLRDVARVFHFKAPTRERLLSRLIQICDLEGIKADKQVGVDSSHTKITWERVDDCILNNSLLGTLNPP